MEHAKNKWAPHQAQSRSTVNEAKELIHSTLFDLSTHHVVYSQLKAVPTELATLNAKLETFLTDEYVAED